MTPEELNRGFMELARQEQATRKRFSLTPDDAFPMLNDDTPGSDFERHYIYHLAWACRALRRINPSLHHDFSSSLNFSVMASAWYPFIFCDYRPAAVQLDGLTCRHEDLTRLSYADNSLASVSCMHVLEHIGLGRYGDAIDYDGDLKAIRELKRVMRPGGDLLIVLPVGRAARIQFNGHRIYRWEDILDQFKDDFAVVESALIPEQSSLGLVFSPDENLLNMQGMGCSCFWFRKH